MRVMIEKEVVRDMVIGRLYIPSVAVEDGGIWSCSASNRAGRIIHKERLNVRGPPSIRPMAPISVVAGQTTNFDCVVVGYPIDNVYWEKSGVVLPVSTRQTVHPNGTLAIQKISREADSGEYTCVATAGETTVRAKLQVSVLVPPEVDRRLFSWGAGYPLGSPARIMCVAIRGDLPIRFHWFHDSRPLQPRNSVSIRYLDDQTSILLFTSLAESDAGNYSCTASNEVSKDSFSSVLLVKVAPSWKEEPEDISVVVGANLKLPCNAIGSPKPNITWRMAQGGVPRQYVPIETLGDNVKISEENRSLSIKAIRRDQGGELLCVASNGVGSDLSKTVKIVVKVPPQFILKEENVTVIAGRRAKISCFAHGNLPINILWFKGIKPVQISSSDLNDDSQYALSNTIVNETNPKFQQEIPKNGETTPKKEKSLGEGFLSSILVSTSSRHDSEVFTCLATNVYGNDSKIINLIVQEVPGQPGSPKVTNTGSRSINLTWDPPSHDGNSQITTYRVLIINSTDSWMNVARIRRMEIVGTTVIVGGLRPAHSYLVRVVAANSIGTSHPSPEVRVITVHEPPTIAPSNVRVIPVSSSSLKVTWMLSDTSMNQLASYGYYIGIKVANTTEPFRYETLEPSSVALHHPEAVLSNLRKYCAYVVTVQAFNEAGAGPKSFPVVARTDEDVPSEPPRDIECSSLSSSSLLLKWRPPESSYINGILQGYKIFYASTEMQTKSVLTQSTTIQGLIPYTNYTITIVAYTRMGEGVRSEHIHCITKEDVPGPVMHLKGLSVDGNSILLSWLPPEKPNGIIVKYSLDMRKHESISPYSSWQSDERMHFPASHSVVDSSLLETFNNAPTNAVQMVPRGRETADNAKRSWIVPGSEDQYLVGGLNERATYSFNVRAATKVGEGPLGASVTQKPRHDAPATIASFSRELTAVWGEELRLSCTVVGKPTPTRTWTYNGQKIGGTVNRIQEYPDGSLLLSEIRGANAGNYSCTVANIHGSDTIVYSVSVKASKDKGAPPSTPLVYVADVTDSSIVLRWRTPNVGQVPILGYYVHSKREYGDWKKMEVEGDAESFTVAGLDCGTRYQVYVTAFNHIGPSQPSDAIATRTLGREPIVPPRTEFLEENATSVSLKLSAWPDGGCRISSFVIEYQQTGSSTWRMVSNYAPWEKRADYVIKNLVPNTSYILRVTAHNTAGSSVATYPFSTILKQGGHLSTEELHRTHWVMDAPVLASALIAVILVAAAISVAVLFTRKRAHADINNDSKDMNHAAMTLSPSSNGTAMIRRTSMDGMNILETYIPSSHQLSPSEETATYYTFKMEAPPPPLPSPDVTRDDPLYIHRSPLRRISYSDKDDMLNSSQNGLQYQC